MEIGLLTLGATLLLACSTLSANAQGTQECGFYYENGTNVIPPGDPAAIVSSSIPETATLSTTILTVYVVDPIPESLTCPDTPDLNYTLGNSTVQLSLAVVGLSEDYDHGLLAENPLLSGSCSIVCKSNGTTKALVMANQVQVIAVNDCTPEFNEPNFEITIEETTSVGVDILSRSDKPLFAQDGDYDKDGKDARIEFSVDNSKFIVLPSFEITSNIGTTNYVERTIYVPRISLAASWNRTDGNSATFTLTAKDQGSPQNMKSIPITVNIKQVDLKNPKFLEDYYTAVADSSQQAGDILPVQQGSIKAVDEDSDDQINYRIAENEFTDSLDVELVPNSDSGEVDVKLKSPVIPGTKKMAYIVIEATQESNSERFDRVVLAVELPLAEETTTTSTTGTPETCPPYITSPPITCPTCPTCDPTGCMTQSPETPVPSTQETCPSCPTCSSPGTSVTSPHSSTATDASSTTTTQNGSVPTDCPVVTCSDTSRTTTTRDNTDCPVVTCPTCTTVCPTTTCTPCPETLPPSSNVSSCPPCQITSIPTLTVSSQGTTNFVDCTTKQPETTTPPMPPKPTVSFEKDQYAAEIIENSSAGTPVVVVKASSSEGSAIIYSLQPGEDSRYFEIDANTGSITLAGSLQKGSYAFHAEGTLPSNEKGVTMVRVEAVKGAPIAGMHFGSPHYKFDIAERSPPQYLVGVIELRNSNDDIIPRITSVEPSIMSGNFYLVTLQNGDLQSISIYINKTFGRIDSGPHVLLDISASSTRSIEVTTVVNVAINDVNEEPRFTVSLPSVIGYPERTFFDPAVSMPIFIFEASDSDEGENGVLSYHLNDLATDNYDIDSKKGNLFVKGMDSLLPTDEDLIITVKDLGGLSKSHQVKVRSLKDDEIHVITAIGPETLTDEEIASDLSAALGYDSVVVLRKEKMRAKNSNTKSLKANADFSYIITVYAVKKDTFIGREDFAKDLEAHLNETTGWIIADGIVVGPEVYKPDKLADDVTAYAIATAVLAAIFGLILVSIACYLVYTFRNYDTTPWSRLIRRSRKGSIEIKENYNDLENTSSGSSDFQIGLVAAGPHIFEGSNKFSDARPAESTLEVNAIQDNQARNPYVVVEDVNWPNSPKPQKIILKLGSNEEDAYCPPTPTPKKSILRDVQQEKESDKLSDRVGVSFDPIPEVINVAFISSLSEDNKAESSSDESDDGAVVVSL